MGPDLAACGPALRNCNWAWDWRSGSGLGLELGLRLGFGRLVVWAELEIGIGMRPIRISSEVGAALEARLLVQFLGLLSARRPQAAVHYMLR